MQQLRSYNLYTNTNVILPVASEAALVDGSIGPQIATAALEHVVHEGSLVDRIVCELYATLAIHLVILPRAAVSGTVGGCMLADAVAFQFTIGRQTVVAHW